MGPEPSFNPHSRRICVLASGGIDSALLLHHALLQGHEVYPLYISADFIWEKAEQYFLERLLGELACSNLHPVQTLHADLKKLLPKNHWAFSAKQVPDLYSPDAAVYLPGRNFLLLTYAALYCQTNDVQEIWLGTLSSNPFPDAKTAFLENFEKSCAAGMRLPIKIQTPFRQWSKEKLIAQYPAFPYHLTFSCLNPNGLNSCQSCNKCEEQRKALEKNSIQKGKLHAFI